ncbi:GNAT family N-acetyltransferase [Wenjunlia tyrosinilytica]|uniref:GCN5 family N-acetyltransferase n=1 Tax=Wenjunlia tyrosinilytica TaxID=1544741 RepID=A0A918DYT7_9ACTN|nr:GNAT family N-acetyltransferase [Wenjunlia tyrosinilytica]GGO91747.1 GCN5 family N-acetyltransferase [Wenjunlia tyrosinilytica]
MDSVRIRAGGPDDAAATTDLLDTAVAWLVDQGRTGQWGSAPWSSQPASVRRIRRYTTDLTVRVAELEGAVVGVCVLSETPQPYVTPADERELYIMLLVTARSSTGRGIGATLVDDARAEAVRRGISLLRTDCYDGDGALVEHYRKLGFRPVRSIDVHVPGRGEPWPCRVLETRV